MGMIIKQEKEEMAMVIKRDEEGNEEEM